MPKPLTDVVIWKARAVPGQRVIPPHLKLAILSRGRILLPPRNVQWLLHITEQRGATWPAQLTADLSQIFAELQVTIELFLNQRLTMTNSDIDTTLQAYLSLRHAKHLPQCRFLLFAWVTHEERELKLDRLFDVDLAMLYNKPRVRVGPGDDRRYILLAYVCLPERITHFIAPEHGWPAPPPPLETMPPLEGITSVSTEWTLRTEPETTSLDNILGEQVGDAIPVLVLDKALIFDLIDAKDRFWYQIKLRSDMTVKLNGRKKVLPADTTCWIVSDGLKYVAAPWMFFRHQLIEFEQDPQYSSLSLGDRITKLRQMSESKDLQADDVIGTRPGIEYQNTRPFISGEWQIAKDYETVRTPDGRVVEIKHLLSGLDILRRSKDKNVKFYPKIPNLGWRQPVAGFDIGSNYAVVTWSGDLGAAAADLTLHVDNVWEKRPENRWASYAERADHYFTTRAGDPDLLADVDTWGIDSLRGSNAASRFATIDSLLAFYYENTTEGGLRTLTVGRKAALERFLEHYGFTYEYDRDIANFPVLPKQTKPVRRVRHEIETFANAWFKQRAIKKWSPLSVPLTKSDTLLVMKDVDAMTELFLYWLECAAIENGAEFVSEDPFQLAQSPILAPLPPPTPTSGQDKYINASQPDIDIIQSAKSKADSWLATVIKTLAAHIPAPDPTIRNLITAFFKTQNPKDLNTILENYRRIQANLDSGITYKVDKTGKFWGSTGGYSTSTSTLGEGLFLGNTTLEEQAGTLIHEAAHRQESPGLTGFRWKFEKYCFELYDHDDSINSPQAWNKLKTSDLISTADIYAAFAAAMNDAHYLGFWGCMPRPLRNTLNVGPP